MGVRVRHRGRGPAEESAGAQRAAADPGSLRKAGEILLEQKWGLVFPPTPKDTREVFKPESNQRGKRRKSRFHARPCSRVRGGTLRPPEVRLPTQKPPNRHQNQSTARAGLGQNRGARRRRRRHPAALRACFQASEPEGSPGEETPPTAGFQPPEFTPPGSPRYRRKGGWKRRSPRNARCGEPGTSPPQIQTCPCRRRSDSRPAAGTSSSFSGLGPALRRRQGTDLTEGTRTAHDVPRRTRTPAEQP